MMKLLFNHESKLFKKGIKNIVGVDEVGRGPLAGPLVVCAVILDVEKILAILNKREQHRNNDVLSEEMREYNQIKDSKLIQAEKREKLANFLKKAAIEYSIVEISHTVIDKQGMSFAIEEGFYSSVKHLKKGFDFVLTDFYKIKNLEKDRQEPVINGDGVSLSIAAASILAKVHRDKIMDGEHKKYPQYGFDMHKGYGTKYHLNALQKYGPCDIHRKSFAPVKCLIQSRS